MKGGSLINSLVLLSSAGMDEEFECVSFFVLFIQTVLSCRDFSGDIRYSVPPVGTCLLC